MTKPRDEPLPLDGEDEREDEEPHDSLDDDDDGPDRVANQNSVSVKSDLISAGTFDLAATIIKKQYNFTMASATTDTVQLSIHHFRSWSPEELDRCETELVFDPEAMSELERALEDRRILVLCGEAESGKGSTALILASKLTKTLGLQGSLVCQGLDSNVQVDLEKICGQRSFQRHVVMLEDALVGESSSLKDFVKTIDGVRVANLSQRLERNDSVLVITATPHSLSEHQKRLEGLGILKLVGTASAELLWRAFQRSVERLPQAPERREELAAVVTEIKANLPPELNTIPRIARFVHDYLGEILEGNLTIQQALSRMDDLSQWLTTDLSGDLDAQAAVLAIVLGSAVPPAAGVPWLLFDQLRRKIVDLFLRELRISDDKPLSTAGFGSTAFLRRARAHIVSMPSPLQDLVRFRDDRYPRRLWQALLGSARGIATLLVPLLKELSHHSEDLYFRACAAAALGRLGQIGPTSLAVPIIEEWARDTSTPDDLLGFFLQGIVASENDGYMDFCLAVLRHQASQEDLAVAQTVVHAWRHLGCRDPALPIRELCLIVRSRLPIQIDQLRLVEREVVAEEEKIRGAGDSRKVARELRVFQAQLFVVMAAALVPAERIPLVGAIRYSLAGVLFSQGGNLGPVLSELTARMRKEPTKLAPLFAYLFLHRRGLFDLLDQHKWISSSLSLAPCSRFLITASRGPEDAATLIQFLEKIFGTLQTFPGVFQLVLEQRLLQVLRNWSKEGCQVIELRTTVIGLLNSLKSAGNPYLAKTVIHFLRTDRHFLTKGSRLHALGTDVLNGRGMDPIPVPLATRRLPRWMETERREID